MPGMVNKIIINSGGIRGMNKAIKSEMRNGEFLAEEMQEHKWLGTPEALAFRDRQEKICAKYDKAQMTMHKEQRELNDDVRRYLDSQLFPPQS